MPTFELLVLRHRPDDDVYALQFMVHLVELAVQQLAYRPTLPYLGSTFLLIILHSFVIKFACHRPVFGLSP